MSALTPGLYTCIKSDFKEIVLKLVANDRGDKRFLLTKNKIVPWGCLSLTCGYIHLLNHEKMCIKSEVEEIILNLQQMTLVMRPSC